MKRDTAHRSVLGLVGLFSALVLADLAGQVKPAQAATTPATTVTSAQPEAAAAVAEASFSLTNQHANLASTASGDDHAMGSLLTEAALKAMTDESASTTAQHVLQAPAGMSTADAAAWLKVAKAEATADYQRTGRAQKIIQVAAAAVAKSFAIGATDVPDVDAIDVASYQKWMTQANYKTLKQNGVQSAIVKVSESTTYANPYAAAQIKYAQNAGMQVGVYHFARFANATQAVAEAKKVISTLQSLKLAKTTRIFADMEAKETNVTGVASNLNQFWQTLSAAGYTNHAVYTGGSFGTTYSSAVAGTVGADSTWYAAYPYTPTASSTLSAAYGFNYGAWQFSSTAYVPGYPSNNIDVSDDYTGVLTDMSTTSSSTGSASTPTQPTQPAQGPWLSKSGYIKVKSPNYDFWKSFGFSSSTSTKAYNGQELVVNGMYRHQNGSTYYSVYTKAGQWLGYLNANAATWEGQQGAWHADDRYVSLKGTSPVYSSFSWKVAYPVATLKGRTYYSSGKYNHMNGNTYLSISDAAGKWIGYVPESDAQGASSDSGICQPASGFVTFSDAKVLTYSNTALTKTKHSGATMAGHTYKVTGKYQTFQGKLVYSVYDMSNKWIGYVDGSKVKLSSNQQGSWVAKDGYVTVSTKGETIWGSFAFSSGKSTSSRYQTTYQINGQYFHSNGETYYSLYDGNGKWIGYLNAKFAKIANSDAGVWIKQAGSLVFAKNYPIWHSLFGAKSGTTSKYYGKTLRVNGKYHHLNGSWYYSIFSGKSWVGYVNADAAVLK